MGPIDHQLGNEDRPGNIWKDVQEPGLDAGWEQTPVTILVPFHQLTVQPGVVDYTVPDFYHQSVLSILKENVMQEDKFQHFHLEPYEHQWQPGNAPELMHVHGELYTSSSFIEAHNNLQNSPGKPGCNLPRVVAALMFASDATHLTSFGETKLWPLYLFFGNHSKYHQSKPTLHLCNYVAYFQKVSMDDVCVEVIHAEKPILISFLMSSKALLLHVQEGKILALHLWHIATKNSCMHSGKSSLTMNLLKHILMVLS